VRASAGKKNVVAKMGGGSGRNLNPLLARVVEGDEHQGKVMAAIHFMLSVTNKHEEKV
jgi:hypothetical protein